jgi:hypothetical protein
MNLKSFSKTNIKIPMDGSCFIHCIIQCFQNDPFFINLISKYIKINSNKVQILRILLAISLTEEDFANYKILCIGESDNTSVDSLVSLRHKLICENMYVNEILIDKLINLFNNEYGFYIFKNNKLISKKEWLNKPKNILIDFVYDCHYELIQLTNLETGEVLENIITNNSINQLISKN